jgi:DNA-binding NarL/FixJ family response regulator
MVFGGHYVDSRLKTAIDDSPLEFKGQVSNHERQVLRRTVFGHSNKEIATALNISVKTVEVHKTNGMRKLDLPDRSALVRHAAMHGCLLEP